MLQKVNPRFLVITGLILIAAFSRLVPHMNNFSPLGSISLFGAAYFSKKWQSILIPLTATWLSDLFINNVIYAKYYPTFTWLSQGFYWQYGSYVLIAIAAFYIFKKINVTTVILGIGSSTIIFFLVSNFGCWLGSTSYPQTFSGLVECYAAGIPFIKGTLLGDIFYSTVLFGSFALLQRRLPAFQYSKI